MRRVVRVAAMGIFAGTLTGCGVSVRTTPLASTELDSVSAENPVYTFTSRLPECPYQEIAHVLVTPNTRWTRRQRVEDAFIARARRLGGDGVIMDDDEAGGPEDAESDDDADESSRESLAGTVIRFADAGCRR